MLKGRIKEIREKLNLSQTEFAEMLNLKRNSISLIEVGKRNPSDRTIINICDKFNISEEWLRNGKGEMFKPAPTDALDKLANDYKLSNASYIAVEKFVNLTTEKRKELIDFFLEVSKAILESDADPDAAAMPDGFVPGFSEDLLIRAFHENAPGTPEELEKEFPPEKPDGNSKTG